MTTIVTTFVSIFAAYLLGSVSSSIIICKITNNPDPRGEGSGNPGATNVLRIAGKKLALFTLLGDILKGVIAVSIGRILGLSPFALSLTALFVFVGHLYPIFFGFKGGKGVATFFGSLLTLSPVLFLAAGIAWIVVAAIFRYSSLSSLVASLTAVIYTATIGNKAFLISMIIITALLFWRHLGNIKRLIKRTETKIKF